VDNFIRITPMEAATILDAYEETQTPMAKDLKTLLEDMSMMYGGSLPMMETTTTVGGLAEWVGAGQYEFNVNLSDKNLPLVLRQYFDGYSLMDFQKKLIEKVSLFPVREF